MKNKKKIILSAIVILMIVLAIVAGIFLCNHEKNSSKNTITFTNDDLNKHHSITLEYANSEVNPLDYIIDDQIDGVKCTPENVSLQVVGDTTVTYTLQNGTEIQCIFKVKDTTAPVITFKSENIKADNIEAFNLTDNIQSVEDLVDGSLMYCDQAPEKIENSTENKSYEVGWYIVTKNESDVLVYACDIHGNVSEASYTFSTEEKNEDNSEKLDNDKLYSYSSLDLSEVGDDSNWNEITTNDWYYSDCTFMSDKYTSVQEAVESVILHENENGNMNITENDVRVFCERDSEGNILYYQAGYEE